MTTIAPPPKRVTVTRSAIPTWKGWTEHSPDKYPIAAIMGENEMLWCASAREAYSASLLLAIHRSQPYIWVEVRHTKEMSSPWQTDGIRAFVINRTCHLFDIHDANSVLFVVQSAISAVNNASNDPQFNTNLLGTNESIDNIFNPKVFGITANVDAWFSRVANTDAWGLVFFDYPAVRENPATNCTT